MPPEPGRSPGSLAGAPALTSGFYHGRSPGFMVDPDRPRPIRGPSPIGRARFENAWRLGPRGSLLGRTASIRHGPSRAFANGPRAAAARLSARSPSIRRRLQGHAQHVLGRYRSADEGLDLPRPRSVRSFRPHPAGSASCRIGWRPRCSQSRSQSRKLPRPNSTAASVLHPETITTDIVCVGSPDPKRGRARASRRPVGSSNPRRVERIGDGF